MKLTGSYKLNVKKEIVWNALNDAEILKQCIPGCDSFEKEDDKTFNASGLYMLLRYAYGKKWNSYLRLGYNRISGIEDKDRNGLLCGFGVDYKLNDKWHFETGYHILSTNEAYASRIACSISRHFKKKDDK